MLFTEGILKILFELPEDQDITKEFGSYLLTCLKACSEALVIFDAKYKEKNSKEFRKAEEEFKKMMKKREGIEMSEALDLVTALRENDDFDDLYSGYIDAINQKIIDDAKAKNPHVIKDFELYLDEYEVNILKSYIDLFIAPEVNLYAEQKLQDEIAEMKAESREEAKKSRMDE